jgi:diadenosine tetraphosphate (Ap4A) HIT family hydrolase
VQPDGARILFEDDRVALFRPRDPLSTLHFLVVPKAHIRNVRDMSGDRSRELVQHMVRVGRDYLNGAAATAGPGGVAVPGIAGSRFCFHVAPGNSIDHLHLHCLSTPISTLRGRIVYSPVFNRFCEDAETTLTSRLPARL